MRLAIPNTAKPRRQLAICSTMARSGMITNCPPVAPAVPIPVASPRPSSKRLAMAVAMTCVATIPNPTAAIAAKPRRNCQRLAAVATISMPAPVAIIPTNNRRRGPRWSTRLPAKGATLAITIKANAPPKDTNSRVQPSSRSQIGIAKPRAARAEKDSARAKNPTPTTSQAENWPFSLIHTSASGGRFW